MIITENWGLWAIILLIVIFSIYLEQNYSWAAKLSGAIIGLIIAAILSNLNIIPTKSSVYDNIWDYVVPLAIPMLLFQCNFKKIWKESGRLIIIFLISSAGTVLGAFIGYTLLHNYIPKLNHVAGMMTGSYIGGGVNFVTVASTFNISSELISAATVSDNLLMVLYFFVLIVLPNIPFFKKNFRSSYEKKFIKTEIQKNLNKLEFSTKNIAIIFAISTTIVAISFNLSKLLVNLGSSPLINFISNKYLLLTTLTVILSTSFSNFFKKIQGSNEIGTFLIYIFFVVIGIPASISSIINNSPLLLVFCTIIVIINMLTTFLFAKIFNFTIEEAIIASNANIGGPTTAVAMAISKGWTSFSAPAMLIGTLGYILGTYFGILIGSYLM